MVKESYKQCPKEKWFSNNDYKLWTLAKVSYEQLIDKASSEQGLKWIKSKGKKWLMING